MSDAEDLSPVAPDSPLKSMESDHEDAAPDTMQTDDKPDSEDVDKAQDGDDAMDDLFGDDDDEVDAQANRPKKRRLDDEELDSGDDLDRADRMMEDGGVEASPELEESRELQATQVELSRHHSLKGSDGEVYLLHQQNFTGIEPKIFNPSTFEPPKFAHNSSEAPGPQFSAAQTAASTIRWRRAPKEPKLMQSNARVIRWSDGSLTLQMGSNPLEQFELPGTARAAPQLRPKKPTPVSRPLKKGMQPPRISAKDNSHYYLCSVNEATGYARVTNHITASLAVRSTKLATDENADDATLKLQEIMAKNAANKQKLHLDRKFETLEDPLEAQRRAIRAEKELAKAERQRQQKFEREQARRAGVMGPMASYGRSGGLGSGYGLGGMDDDMLGRPRPKAPRKKTNKPRYSDDEEDFRSGRTKEDNYDEEDDFIAPSDEELEEEGDNDDEEELLDDDEDAEGEADDDADADDAGAVTKPAPAAKATSQDRGDSTDAAAVARGKRRTVIDDDDDDDE